MHQISPSVCGSLMWQQNNRVPSQPNRTHSACKTDTEKPNSRFPWLFAGTGVNGTMCVALQTHRTEYSECFSSNPVKRCVFSPSIFIQTGHRSSFAHLWHKRLLSESGLPSRPVKASIDSSEAFCVYEDKQSSRALWKEVGGCRGFFWDN